MRVMATLKRYVRAVVLSRAELQAAVLATFNLTALAGIYSIDPEILAAVNAAIGVWMGAALSILYRANMEEFAAFLNASPPAAS